MSQIFKIKRHLESGKTLTQQQAILLFRSYRLASIIHRLKTRDGVAIETNLVDQPDGSSYAQYYMPEHCDIFSDKSRVIV